MVAPPELIQEVKERRIRCRKYYNWVKHSHSIQGLFHKIMGHTGEDLEG